MSLDEPSSTPWASLRMRPSGPKAAIGHLDQSPCLGVALIEGHGDRIRNPRDYGRARCGGAGGSPAHQAGKQRLRRAPRPGGSRGASAMPTIKDKATEAAAIRAIGRDAADETRPYRGCQGKIVGPIRKGKAPRLNSSQGSATSWARCPHSRLEKRCEEESAEAAPSEQRCPPRQQERLHPCLPAPPDAILPPLISSSSAA